MFHLGSGQFRYASMSIIRMELSRCYDTLDPVRSSCDELNHLLSGLRNSTHFCVGYRRVNSDHDFSNHSMDAWVEFFKGEKITGRRATRIAIHRVFRMKNLCTSRCTDLAERKSRNGCRSRGKKFDYPQLTWMRSPASRFIFNPLSFSCVRMYTKTRQSRFSIGEFVASISLASVDVN